MQLIRYYRNENNYPEALNNVNKVIGMCQPNHYSVLIQMYDHLVAIYTRLGNKEMAINSHQQFYDLKSPVVAQKTLVENILKNLDAYDKPRMLQSLQGLHHSSEAQLELLQNLLNWARMQTGQMQYTPVRFDIGELIKEVAEMFELPAQNKGVAIRTDAPEGCIVQADRLMIHTVLRNLVNNAVKFTGTGGEVVLSVSCDDEKAHVSVKDNGTGMTAEQTEKLFVVGESRSTTGTHGEKGSGLGLIICKELLERNGSGIEVRSMSGVGTIVEFELMK